MKKLFTALCAALTLVSCSMDRVPEGSVPDTDALHTAKDFESLATGLHATMRVVTSGDYVILSDIQLDDFNAILGNGNRRMEFYNKEIQPETGEVGAVYAGFYTVIAQTNFLIDGARKALADGQFKGNDLDKVKRACGQALFFRAYCYQALATLFCPAYVPCTTREKEGTGLSLQIDYDPTADNTKYKGRSSLQATYNQIMTDLKEAIALLQEYEAKTNSKPSDNIQYATSDAAKALLARVYNNIGMYGEAVELAEELILADGGKRYPLITDKREFYRMWRNDVGSEIIWLVSADYAYHGSATGKAFANNNKNPDYVPNNEAVFLFQTDDVRWSAWFDCEDSSNPSAKLKTIVTSAGSAELFQFVKYPGNPELQDASARGSNYINMMKPLRIGEMYLIAAEGYYMLSQEEKAKFYLERIETARQAMGYTPDLTGTELQDEIRNERRRELMGEGLRLADLKRWGVGFVRSGAFEERNHVLANPNRHVEYEPNDDKYTWPIPQHEMDINPQMKGQQNPGYGN